MSLERFTDYELAPVHCAPDKTCEPMCSMADALAAVEAYGGSVFWSLYGRLLGRGVDCLADRKCWEDIAELYSRISGCPAPEQEGRYYCLPVRSP